MILIWFLLAGIVVGYLRRGNASRLSELRLRGAWLVIVALAVQLLIFPLGDAEPLVRFGTPYLHVISYLPLLAFVYLNRRYRELLLVGVGMVLNLIVILANGGYMPTSPFALERAGESELLAYLKEHRFSGNVVLMGDNTRLDFLGDLLYLPPEVPFATAFSVGDLLLGVGIFLFLASKGSGTHKESGSTGTPDLRLLEELLRSEDIAAAAQRALRRAIELIPEADAGSFILLDEKDGLFRYVASVGWDEKKLKSLSIKPEEFLQEKERVNEVKLWEDLPRTLRKRSPELYIFLSQAGLLPKSSVTVPVVHEGRVVGYFNIDSRKTTIPRERISVVKEFKYLVEIALSVFLEREALIEEEKRFRVLFEKAPDAIYIVDFEGNILDCNEAASQQTGYSREELRRMNIVRDLAVDPPFAPEYINHHLLKGETVTFEEKKRRKDGSIFYTEVALSCLDYGGRKIVISHNRDITPRKEYEEHIDLIWRSSYELFRARTLEEALKKGVSLGRALTDAEVFGIYLLQGDGYRLRYAEGTDPGRAVLPDRVPSRNEPTIQWPPGYRGFTVPIDGVPDIKGFLAAGSRKHLAPHKRKLAEILGLILGNVFQTIKHTKRLEEFANRLERLHEAVTLFNRAQDEKEMCDVAVRALEEALGLVYCGIALREGDYLVPVSRSRKVPPDMPRKFRVDEGLVGRTLREQRTFWGGDISEVPDAKPVRRDIRSFISVPVGDVGVIQVISDRKDAFTQEDVKLVEILAQQLYEGIKRVRLEREIRDQAVRDPLTGLFNRRYLQGFVELYRARHPYEPLGIIILDLDGFKEVNDRFGHTVGDKFLKEVGAFIAQRVRGEDVVVRWGGDEFLILIPGKGKEAAEEAARRLREELRNWRPRELPEVKLDFTAGVSEWLPDGGKSFEEALMEADRELYLRKKR